jgi:hypothetical protein
MPFFVSSEVLVSPKIDDKTGGLLQGYPLESSDFGNRRSGHFAMDL